MQSILDAESKYFYFHLVLHYVISGYTSVIGVFLRQLMKLNIRLVESCKKDPAPQPITHRYLEDKRACLKFHRSGWLQIL